MDHAQQHPAEHGAGNRADAAEYRRHKRLDAGHGAGSGRKRGIRRAQQHARNGRQRTADGKRQRDGCVYIDAHQLRRAPILGDSQHGVAHLCFIHKQRKARHNGGGSKDRCKRLARDDECAVKQAQRLQRDDRRKGFRRGAENEKRKILQKIAHADGRNQHGKAGRLPQGLIGHTLDRNTQQGAHQHRRANTRQRGHAHRGHYRERNIATHHNHVTVRKVQHTCDAVNHRVAQRNYGVNTAKADPVHKVR